MTFRSFLLLVSLSFTRDSQRESNFVLCETSGMVLVHNCYLVAVEHYIRNGISKLCTIIRFNFLWIFSELYVISAQYIAFPFLLQENVMLQKNRTHALKTVVNEKSKTFLFAICLHVLWKITTTCFWNIIRHTLFQNLVKY